MKNYNDVTWEVHGILNHQTLDCLFNTLFWLTSKVQITGPLWGESIYDQWRYKTFLSRNCICNVVYNIWIILFGPQYVNFYHVYWDWCRQVNWYFLEMSDINVWNVCFLTHWGLNKLKTRNHSGYGLSQWKEALLCNASSHWRIPYPEWYLNTILQMTFFNAFYFYWIKMFVFWFKFHWSLFVNVQLSVAEASIALGDALVPNGW